MPVGLSRPRPIVSPGHSCLCRRACANACLIACTATNASTTTRPWPYGPVGPLVARAAYRSKVDRTLRVRNPAHGVCSLLCGQRVNEPQSRLSSDSSYPSRALGDAVSRPSAVAVFPTAPRLSKVDGTLRVPKVRPIGMFPHAVAGSGHRLRGSAFHTRSVGLLSGQGSGVTIMTWTDV